MPSTTVNATRMELTRLKKKLKTAVRGHKLLKDKRDELMKQFLDMIRENRALRTRVEEALMRAHGSFTVASALMSSEMLEQSLIYPKQSVELNMSFKNIMSVDTPVYHFSTQNPGSGDIYPYSFATTSCELDGAVDALSSVFRRVNALEYVMIPEMEENIKYISMKLDENERNNTIRLMKVKDMMLQEELEAKRKETEAMLEKFKEA